jgi:4-hydroxy-tetrahydrodipicolinate reductase
MTAAKVTIIGATGRMGRALIRAVAEFPALALHGAVTHAGSPNAGADAGELAGAARLNVRIGTDVAAALAGADVAIDFSSAQSAVANAVACAHARVPLLLGTTGLGSDAQAELDSTARHIPLIVAANTSLALNVLLSLVRQAAKALPASYDIEIFEAHHRDKVDAPSGTALVLGQAAAAGRGVSLPARVKPTGVADGPREAGSIGFAVVRGGDVVGEHDVRFLGSGEQLSLGHVVTDRTVFARGALTGALWLVGKPPGRYTMADVLSL